IDYQIRSHEGFHVSHDIEYEATIDSGHEENVDMLAAIDDIQHAIGQSKEFSMIAIHVYDYASHEYKCLPPLRIDAQADPKKLNKSTVTFGNNTCRIAQ